MELTIFILSAFFLGSCGESQIKSERKFYFYHTVLDRHGFSFTDTLSFANKVRHDEKDSLIYRYNFQFNNGWHTIQVLTNDFYAPIDGGYISYTLDSIGIIYRKSTTWYSCEWIRTNNDSINTIIDAAFGNILMHQELSNYRPNKPSIKFKTPKVY
jgi:hypothetical protein